MTIDYQGGALLINVPALRVTIEVATPFQFRTPTLPQSSEENTGVIPKDREGTDNTNK